MNQLKAKQNPQQKNQLHNLNSLRVKMKKIIFGLNGFWSNWESFYKNSLHKY